MNKSWHEWQLKVSQWLRKENETDTIGNTNELTMQNWRQPQSSNIYSNSSVNDAGSGILSYLLNCLPDFLPVQRQRVMFSFSFSFVVCFALFLFFFPALNNIFVHVSQKNKNRIANDLVEYFPPFLFLLCLSFLWVANYILRFPKPHASNILNMKIISS